VVPRFIRTFSPVWNGICDTFNSVDDCLIGLQKIISVVVENKTQTFLWTLK
jgi:hypothetical protein